MDTTTFGQLGPKHLNTFIYVEDGPADENGDRPYALQGVLESIEHHLGHDSHPQTTLTISIDPNGQDLVHLRRSSDHAVLAAPAEVD